MANRVQVVPWDITLERVYKKTKLTFRVQAVNSKVAMTQAKVRLELSGERARYWYVIGLQRV